MWILFYILFILTSITVLTIPNLYDNFWIQKECVFNILGFAFIASSWIGNNPKILTFKNKWIAIIFIYLVLSFGWFFYLPLITSKLGTKVVWNLWVIRPFINIVLGLWIIQTLVEYTDSLQRWVNISKMLCWAAFGFSIYSIFQVWGFDPIFKRFGTNNLPVTFFGNSNLTGNFLAILSPICLIFKDFRYKIIYALCFIAILLTNSSVSLISFIAGLFIYLLLTKKWKIVLLLALTGILFVVVKKPAFFSFSGRFKIWNDTLGYCKDTLWLGKGLGNFAANQYKPLDSTVAISAHCEPLQILHDSGIFMVSLIGIYFLDLFRRIFISKWNMLLIGFTSALSAYLIICFGNFPLRIAPMALTGIIYIAAIETILIKGE